MPTDLVSSPTPAPSAARNHQRRTSDASLTAVIHGKPPSDQVPTAVWWFLAECLEHSVTIRRALDGAAALPHHALLLIVKRARFAGEAALDELDAPPKRGQFDATAVEPPALHVSIRDLARIVVTHRRTPAEILRQAIHAHLAVLVSSAEHAGGSVPASEERERSWETA
jgi:hypothetical protein